MYSIIMNEYLRYTVVNNTKNTNSLYMFYKNDNILYIFILRMCLLYKNNTLEVRNGSL